MLLLPSARLWEGAPLLAAMSAASQRACACRRWLREARLACGVAVLVFIYSCLTARAVLLHVRAAWFALALHHALLNVEPLCHCSGLLVSRGSIGRLCSCSWSRRWPLSAWSAASGGCSHPWTVWRGGLQDGVFGHDRSSGIAVDCSITCLCSWTGSRGWEVRWAARDRLASWALWGSERARTDI